MELAKITLREHITIPVTIRKKLVKDGDKVIFLKKMGLLLWKIPSGLP
jgi:bifunctional DNA-binding transcriptional regulator/antitoxin component of YhaV-PrlF toxin-antitoxin module